MTKYFGNVGVVEVVSASEITLLEAYARAVGTGAVVAVAARVGVTRQTMAKAYKGTECSKPLSEHVQDKTGLPAEPVCFLHKARRWVLHLDKDGYATVLDNDQWTRVQAALKSALASGLKEVG